MAWKAVGHGNAHGNFRSGRRHWEGFDPVPGHISTRPDSLATPHSPWVAGSKASGELLAQDYIHLTNQGNAKVAEVLAKLGYKPLM
jgi:hypothetical protein